MPNRSIAAAILFAAGTTFAVAQSASDTSAQGQVIPPAGGAMMPSGTNPGAMGAVPAGHMMMMGGKMELMMHSGMMAECRGMGMIPFDHIEGRIAFLKAEIGITEPQAAQWNAFADALRADADVMRRAHAAAAQADRSVSAPARLEAAVQRMSGRLDATKRLLAAEKPLYAVLSNDQKKMADELLLDPEMGMGREMMRGHP